MVKFFDPEDISSLPESEKEKYLNQKLDDVESLYNCNSGNCMLTCNH